MIRVAVAGEQIMVVIWGTRLFGKTDVVPGLFHVATRFGHIDYFPLFPRGTYIVLAQHGDQFQGVQVPLSFKSVLLAWARAISLLATLIAALFAVASWARPAGDPLEWAGPTIAFAASAVFALFLFRSKTATHASYDRACQLGEIIGLNDEGRAMIEQHYGFNGVARDLA